MYKRDKKSFRRNRPHVVLRKLAVLNRPKPEPVAKASWFEGMVDWFLGWLRK